MHISVTTRTKRRTPSNSVIPTVKIESPFEAALTVLSSIVPVLSTVGASVGDVLGRRDDVGVIVGDDDGTTVEVGLMLGDTVGSIVGGIVGDNVGEMEG